MSRDRPRWNPFRPSRLSKLRSEAGFALVEVMVSAVLLVSLSLATYPILDQSAGRTSSNRARGVAVSLAEQDQDRMRALPLATLAGLNQTSTDSANGTVFTIQSKAQWTSDSTGIVVCSAATGAAQYLRITTTITWPNMNGIDPVTMESIVSPNVAGTNRGTVVVTMSNAAGGPQAGIPVTVQGTTKSTDATGCAIWTDVPPTPTGTISFNSSGYLTKNFVQSFSETVPIVAGQTSSKSYEYDLASSFPTTIKALVDGTASAWTAVRYVSGSSIQQRPATTATTPFASLTAAQASGFYPFTAGYNVYAGDCDGNNPIPYKSDYYSSNPTRMVMPTPGASTAATAYMYRLYLTVIKNTTATKLGTKKPNIVVTPSGAAMAGCDGLRKAGTAGSSTTNASTGNLVDLPWGVYTLCVDDNNPTVAQIKRKTITLNLNATPAGGTPAPTATTSAAPMKIDIDSAAVGNGSTGTAGTLGTGACP